MSLLDDASLIVTPNGYKGGSPNGTLYSVKPTSGAGDMVVTRNTTATRVNSAGLIESVAINVPRLDYPPLGGCPSILVEPARTNLVLYSEQFDNASWGKINATVTANTITAPDGTSTADTINLSAAAAPRVTQICSIANSTTYTLSCFFKNIALTAGQTFDLRYNNQLTAPSNFEMIATIDLAAGTATYSSSGTPVTGYSGTVTGAVEPYANGWYHISVTITTGTLAAANGQVQIIHASQARSFYAWGAQLEAGSNATSYIPTTISALARNADVISKTGISSLIGQTEGTIFVEANLTANTAERRIITISNGTDSQRIMFWTFGTTLYANFNTILVTIGTFPILPISTAKMALAYTIAGGSTTYSLKLNNNTLITGTAAAAAPTPLTNINLGSSPGGSLFLNDRIKSVILFKTALSPPQLANLTAI